MNFYFFFVEMEGNEVEVRKRTRMTRNVKSLLVPLVLFGTITVAQTVGAIFASSLALLADAASMFLDTLTYVGNLYAECSTKGGVIRRRRNQLIASGSSFFVLLGLTIYVLTEGVARVQADHDPDGDDVNVYIVFGFAVAGILFDILSLVPFILNKLKPGRSSARGSKVILIEGHGLEHGDSSHVNMCSALLHILSDLMRSITTLVASLLIWFGSFDGRVIDGWAAIIVSAIIIAGILGALVYWLRDCHDLYVYAKSPLTNQLADNAPGPRANNK